MLSEEDVDAVQACSTLQWSHLRLPGAAPATPGWSACIAPGVVLLLDVSGEASAHWLPVLAAHAVAQSGPTQVFWRNPREPLAQPEQLVHDWVAAQVQHWPLWDAMAWQQHVQGFQLHEQLAKPLWHLSTGSLRKLWLTAALASGAAVTLVDEPIAGLDGNALRYLSHALDALGEQLAQQPTPQRWVMVAHWEALPGVTWDEQVLMPAPPMG